MSRAPRYTSHTEGVCGSCEVNVQRIKPSLPKPSGETTSAGLLFLPEWSVNGNGTNTTVPLR